MTHRERVKNSLSHIEPDRLPIDFGGTFLTSAPVSKQKALVDILGITGERDPYLNEFDDRIQKYFDCDLRMINPTIYPDFGFDWNNLAYHPFKDGTINDIDHYPWPVPEDRFIAGLEEKAEYLHKHTGYAICAGQIGQGLFELSCYLRGYDIALLDLMVNPDFVHRFNTKALEKIVKLNDLYFGLIGEYVDIVMIGDDFATQNSTYMSLEMFRELYKPYYKEYVNSVKKHCPNAIIAAHSCGSSYDFLNDLHEIGIRVINPVQTTANKMAPNHLKTKKDKLSFLGGIDLQYILPYGSEKEVRAFVKNIIKELGPGGGYILAPCHTVPEDCKPENIVIMLETAKEYSSYPLEILLDIDEEFFITKFYENCDEHI